MESLELVSVSSPVFASLGLGLEGSCETSVIQRVRECLSATVVFYFN